MKHRKRLFSIVMISVLMLTMAKITFLFKENQSKKDYQFGDYPSRLRSYGKC